MPGGQIATAMVDCARLGWRARYVGSFGDDEFGALSRDSLIAKASTSAPSRTVAGATNQFAVVLVDARIGERPCCGIAIPALTMAADDVPQKR